MNPVLELTKISKFFDNKFVYLDTSFCFVKGCYAVVGPNGVGKTVLLEMLAGVLLQDAGSIFLSGSGKNTSLAYKRKLTYIPSESAFFPMATGMEFLEFVS